MVKKKVVNIDEYVTAGRAAEMLTERLGRPISNDYICQLATRKKKPGVECVIVGTRRLYKKAHIENVQITKHQQPKGGDAA